MEELNVYSGTSNNITLIALALIMTAGSLVVVVIGHKLQTNDIRTMTIGIGSAYALLLGLEMLNRNKCPKMKIYRSFKREIVAFISFFAFVIIVIAFIPFGFNIIGIFGTMFFGLALIFTLLGTVKKNPSLIIKEESFIANSTLLSIGEIKYSDIKEIFIYTYMGNKQLIIIVDNIREKIKKLNPVKKVLFNFSAGYITIPSNRVDMSLEELENLLKTNQIRCIK